MTPFALDHPLVRQYLRRLDEATSSLPSDERRDIREGIRSHLQEALRDARNDADVRNALDRVGDPRDIVGTRRAVAPSSRRGAMEIAAVVLLLIGGLLVPLIGWLAGVVLLWASNAWTTRQKLIGTFVVPGGLSAVVMLAVLPIGTTTCAGESDGIMMCSQGPPSPAVMIACSALLVAAQWATAIYLLRSARRPALAADGMA